MYAKTFILLLILFLPACALVYDSKDIAEHVELMKAANSHGCAFIAGSGTPPASRVDGGAVGAWGTGMTPEIMITWVEKLQSIH
jgi:hypothetical protein